MSETDQGSRNHAESMAEQIDALLPTVLLLQPLEQFDQRELRAALLEAPVNLRVREPVALPQPLELAPAQPSQLTAIEADHF